MEKTKHQAFEVQAIRRSQINPAPYNPRVIGDDERKRLKKAIKAGGLMSTLVWNKRTGNLVSGHQRLSVLDELEGFPGKKEDYLLDVAVVDLDDKAEKKANVWFNNPSMQGGFDFEKLALFNLNDGISFDDLGFSQDEVDFMFDGDARFSEIFQDTTEVTESKENLKAVKEARKAAQERLTTENSADFYFVVVFRDQEEKDECLRALGQPITEQYINGAVIRRMTGEKED